MRSTLRLLALALAIAFTSSAFAQTSTKGFSFQGYAIDPDGKSLSSTGITVRFTLSSVSNAGTPFEEEHTTTTDAFGVFHAIVGNSTVAKNLEFSKLNFTKVGDEEYTLKVEVKKTSGGTYTTISNAPLNAVPYARVAENGVPVGTIVAFAGPKANIPAGWIYCDGSTISRTTYAQLFNVISTSWGTGDGTSTFHLPYLKGHFLRGVDDGRGLDENKTLRSASGTGGNTGDAVGSVEWDQIGSHSHTGITATGEGAHQHNYTSPLVSAASLFWEIQANDTDGTNNGRTKEYPSGTTTGAGEGAHQHNFTTNASGGGENQVDNAYVYWIIKY